MGGSHNRFWRTDNPPINGYEVLHRLSVLPYNPIVISPGIGEASNGQIGAANRFLQSLSQAASIRLPRAFRREPPDPLTRARNSGSSKVMHICTLIHRRMQQRFFPPNPSIRETE